MSIYTQPIKTKSFMWNSKSPSEYQQCKVFYILRQSFIGLREKLLIFISFCVFQWLDLRVTAGSFNKI